MASYFVDSHCHLHDKSCFPDGAEDILKESQENNVRQIIVIGTSHPDSLAAADFAEKHPDVYCSYGIHPEYAASPLENLPLPETKKLVAIGEVGLDYHYHPYDRSAQIKLFESMLELAEHHHLPLIFHIREAFDDFFPIIDNAHVQHAVVHSFSDSPENLQKVLDRGFYVGVNGLATFAPIPLPPLDRILLETDAPYLTPVPFRGKINKSAYIRNIADFLAVKKGVSSAEIASITTKNVQTLFHLPHPILRSA